jgi:hypothetical protein
MNIEKKIVSVNDFIVTETVIEPKTPVADLEEYLRSEKTTGKVQYDLSRGGKSRYLLTERTRLTQAQSAQLRAILGWSENNS